MKKKFVANIICLSTALVTLTSEAHQVFSVSSSLSTEHITTEQTLFPLTSTIPNQLITSPLSKNKTVKITTADSSKYLQSATTPTTTNFGKDPIVSGNGRYTFYNTYNVGQFVHDNVTGTITPLNFNAVINGEPVHISENSLVTDVSNSGRYFIFIPDYYDLSNNKIGSSASYTSGVYVYDRANSTVRKVRTTGYYDVSFVNQGAHLKISDDGVFLTEGVGFCHNVGNVGIVGSACNTIPQLFVRNLLNNNTKQIASGNTVIEPLSLGNYSYNYLAETNNNSTQISYNDFLPNDDNAEGDFIANNFAQSNEANRISVAMAPQTMPFLMPAAGGSISYNFNISNRSESTTNLSLRRVVFAPNGAGYFITSDTTFSLTPNQGLGNITDSFSLPSSFPQGKYTVQYIVTEGSSIAGYGEFTFNKL